MRIAGTNSNLLARAYGAALQKPPTHACIETRADGVRDTASLASIRAAQPASRAAGPNGSGGVERLVAATVPGRVDFDGDTSSLTAPGAYTMYGRPADKNAAAVAVHTGRSLDITG